MVDGSVNEPSLFAKDKAAHRWMVAAGDHAGEPVSLAKAEWNVAIPPAFSQSVYTHLRPGTVLVVTNNPVREAPVAPKGFSLFHHTT